MRTSRRGLIGRALAAFAGATVLSGVLRAQTALATVDGPDEEPMGPVHAVDLIMAEYELFMEETSQRLSYELGRLYGWWE